MDTDTTNDNAEQNQKDDLANLDQILKVRVPLIVKVAQKRMNINNVLKRLNPKPEFVCFPGDEISGLINDKDELLKQWD